MSDEFTVVVLDNEQVVAPGRQDLQVVITTKPDEQVVLEGGLGPVGPQGPVGPFGGTVEITVTIDGGGQVIPPGPLQAYKPVSVSGTLIGWYMVADEVGSISLDVWKAHAQVPTAANLISGLSGPALLDGQIASANILSGWQTVIAAGDVFGFNVAACVVIKRLTLVLVFH
jgi:hypothetical protein